MKFLASALLVTVAAGCGDKKAEPARTEPAAATTSAVPAPKKDPTPAPKVAPTAVDPSAFVAVDLSAIPALADVVAEGPPGATVTPDAPPFNQEAPLGVVIAQGDFRLHLRWGTVGGERSTIPMRADMEQRAKYVETTSTPELVEYTLEAEGATSYGMFRPIAGFRREKDDPYGQLLCGPEKELASPDALAPYRAACDAVTKKK